eukprot:scaffold968_cov171-Amphora_coffeaeformis.AAC.12
MKQRFQSMPGSIGRKRRYLRILANQNRVSGISDYERTNHQLGSEKKNGVLKSPGTKLTEPLDMEFFWVARNMFSTCSRRRTTDQLNGISYEARCFEGSSSQHLLYPSS